MRDADWVAIDRDNPRRGCSFRADTYTAARAQATRQLGIPSVRVHCVVVAESESVASALERARREAWAGPRQAGRAQVEVRDGSGVTGRGKVST